MADQKPWELTPDKIADLYVAEYAKRNTAVDRPDDRDLEVLRALARAVVASVTEWGDELCIEHTNPRIRRMCKQCWRSLQQGTEE